MRSTPGWKMNVTTPATQAAATSRQSLRPTGGTRADEHVAEHAAAQRRRAGQHEHAEQVEPLLHRDQAAGQREDEHPDEVEDQLQLGVLDEHGGGQNYLCGVACFALAGEDGRVWAVGRPGRWRCKTCD